MLAVLLLVIGSQASNGWTYLDAPKWSRDFPACAGNMQSPINVDQTRYDPAMPAFRISLPRSPSINVGLKNNGHTLRVAFPKKSVQMEGAILPDAFGVTQVHMHFGAHDHEGSEHTLFGQKFPLEMHWTSEEMAVPKQFAIFATLFEIGEPSAPLDYVFSFLGNLTEPGKEILVDVPISFLKQLLPERAGTEFYCYHGSLTTPPCTQSVEWIVAARQLTVSQEQMVKLRTLRGHGNVSIAPNFRPVQPQMWRGVYSSFSSEAESNATIASANHTAVSHVNQTTDSRSNHTAPSPSLTVASPSSPSSILKVSFGNTSVGPLYDPCVDASPSCAAWALDGRCSQEWVLKHCQRSCHSCLPRTCEDDNNHCTFWREQNLCRRITNSSSPRDDEVRDRWVNYVVHHCPRSCGNCPTLGGIWAQTPERAVINAHGKDNLILDNAARITRTSRPDRKEIANAWAMRFREKPRSNAVAFFKRSI